MTVAGSACARLCVSGGSIEDGDVTPGLGLPGPLGPRVSRIHRSKTDRVVARHQILVHVVDREAWRGVSGNHVAMTMTPHPRV